MEQRIYLPLPPTGLHPAAPTLGRPILLRPPTLKHYSVVREYTGHGIGREMHEDPQIPNFGLPGTGPVLKKGMTLAIEPMLNIGDCRTRVADDHWTVLTADGSLSAHFEHTIAVNNTEAEVLTKGIYA